MSRIPAASRIAARIGCGLALAMLCASCATNLQPDDGLIGLTSHLLRNGRPPRPTPRDAGAAPPVSALAEHATEPALPVPRVGGSMPYRTSPGDVLQVGYFKKPPHASREVYRVQSGDVLDVHMSAHERLTADLTVRPDGYISFYEIGDFKARGKTVAEIRGGLRDAVTAVVPGADVAVFLRRSHAQTDAFLETLKGNLNDGAARSVRIKYDGCVNFPLIGEVRIAGKTLPELSTELEALYDSIFHGGLSVSVNMVSAGAGNLVVLGEVRQPGLFSLYAPVHPLEVIAMAGGQLDTAGLDKLTIVRRGEDGTLRRFQPLAERDAPAGTEEPPVVLPHDMVIVPRSTVANINLFVDQCIRKTMPFRTVFGLHYRLDD